MFQGVFGRKIGMSRWFDQEGDSYPVTLVKCGPCYVIDISGTKVKLGFEQVGAKNINKAQKAYLEKNNLPLLRHFAEFEWTGKPEDIPEKGSRIGAEVFEVGEKLDIRGRSKGKGFSGVVKRWNFSGGRKTHGSHSKRIPGSIGQSSNPSRVWPGLRMAGRKGGVFVRTIGVSILEKDEKENILVIKGAVPGPKKQVIKLFRSRKAVK
jgi:large subunit ribosomal protein L3